MVDNQFQPVIHAIEEHMRDQEINNPSKVNKISFLNLRHIWEIERLSLTGLRRASASISDERLDSSPLPQVDEN